jgi:hypothetical protein
MTCTHVLDLIDAGPFADCAPAHRDAAWAHARTCATCGPALQTMTMLAAALPALSAPGASSDFTSGVLARVAAIDDGAPARRVSETALAGSHPLGDISVWIAAIAALAAICVVATAAGPAAAGAVRLSLFTRDAPVSAFSASPGSLAIIISLALYIAGLFAPLAGGSSRSPSHATRT